MGAGDVRRGEKGGLARLSNNYMEDTMERVVIVTGASRGIGYEIAKKFLIQKDKVIIASRNKDIGLEAEKKLSQYGICKWFAVDIADEDKCELLITKILHEYGRIDVLVNNAAFILRGYQNSLHTILDLDMKQMREVLNINLLGSMQMIKYAGRIMVEQREKGVIINIGSSVGEFAYDGLLEYSISKAAVSMLVKNVALQLAKCGVRCVTVSPGAVDPLNGHFDLHMNGMVVEAEKIANIVYFISSRDASAINGTEVFADDGFTSFRGNRPTLLPKFLGIRFRRKMRMLCDNYKRILVIGTSRILLKYILRELMLSDCKIAFLGNSQIKEEAVGFVTSENIYTYESDESLNVNEVEDKLIDIKGKVNPDCVIIPCNSTDKSGYLNVYEVVSEFNTDVWWVFEDANVVRN